MTKRLCSLILAFLLCASLCAAGEGDVSEMAAAAGLTVTASDNPDGALLCDYVVESSRKASVSWSDREQIYTVTGDAEAVSQLYVDAVSQGGWESCRYIVGRKARVSFGADSRLVCDTLEDYLGRMESTLGVTVSVTEEAAAPSNAQLYILNTNTKKFHYPDCYSVGQMKDKNRQEYTGTREAIIAMGYKPCGNCHP